MVILVRRGLKNLFVVRLNTCRETEILMGMKSYKKEDKDSVQISETKIPLIRILSHILAGFLSLTSGTTKYHYETRKIKFI